jgi:SAM-dependent methyltransferase
MLQLPDLHVPTGMLEMNYGCGATVGPRDLHGGDTVLYVGVGGGLEALQFAYFTRRKGSVIAVDPVGAMRQKAADHFLEAAALNPWFDPEFIVLMDGHALDLPVRDNSVTIAAQNCLFNVFTAADLHRAIAEVARALMPGGMFSTSDPITPVPLPAELTNDERLRARCLSGCQTLPAYLQALTDAGFGRVEVRARYPYRLLTPGEYPVLTAPVLLESVEVAAFKVPPGPYGPEIFTGRTAIFQGPEPKRTDGHGHTMRCGIPLPVSDAAADALAKLPGVIITPPTYHARTGGCC